MTPIRKNELEHWESVIKDEFLAHRNNLERKINNETDKVVNKSFNAFKKKIGIDKEIANYFKAKKEYNDFCETKLAKETALKKKALENLQKLKNAFKNKSDSNDWNAEIDSNYRDDMVEKEDVDQAIRSACKIEARRMVEKMDVSKSYKEIRNRQNLALNILYSGNSINKTVSELAKLFKASGMDVAIPNNLLTPQITK